LINPTIEEGLVMTWKTTCVMVLGGVGLFVANEARADEPAAGGTATATTTATTPAAPAAPAAAAKAEEGAADHDRFVGRFGVGYFGLRQLPLAGGAPGGLTKGTVDTPVIGGRYWLQRNLGIDAGLGFALVSGSTEVVNANNSQSVDKPSQLGFAFHLGVPIAFAHGKHYTFELIPETDIGFTSGTIKAAPGSPAGTPDTNLSGFLFDIGARVGAEIHFGFIGVPELALEGGIGLYFRRLSYKVKQDPNSQSDGTTTFGTAVPLTNPWGLFLNQVNAIYYF
jgi:hypothetical protein